MSVTRRQLIATSLCIAASLHAAPTLASLLKPIAVTKQDPLSAAQQEVALRWVMDAELTRQSVYGAQDALCALRGTGRRFQPMQMRLVH